MITLSIAIITATVLYLRKKRREKAAEYVALSESQKAKPDRFFCIEGLYFGISPFFITLEGYRLIGKSAHMDNHSGCGGIHYPDTGQIVQSILLL